MVRIKNIVFGIIVLFSLNVQAQKGYKKVSTKQVEQYTTIYDLITALPKGCKVYSFDLSVTGEKGFKSRVVPSDTLSKTLNELLPKPMKGNKINIQILTSSCFKNKTVEYLFVIEEPLNKG